MNRWYLSAGLLLCLTPLALAQDANQNGGIMSNHPAGTRVTERTGETIVKPKRAQVQADAGTIKSAQAALNSRGYDAGTPDGRIGPKTSAAVTRFQADQGLDQTGRLDASTLSHLNVGGTDILATSPKDLGRGGKAAAHDVVEGHPVAAGKAGAEGAANFGKKVGKGSKSLAVRGVEKVGKGISTIGEKVTGTVQGGDKDDQKTPDNAPKDNNANDNAPK